MKKICFVTTISMTLKAFLVDTAKYLYENGDYDITFICDNDEEFAKTLPYYIKYIPVSMERGVSISGIGAIFKMIYIFKKEKFDLVQYSTPNASLYASIAGKLAGVPIRLYCQWGLVYVGFEGFKRKFFKAIEKLICSLSTWIEPDSFGNLKFSREEGLYKGEKSSVVWNGSANGVNIDKFNIDSKEEWSKEIRDKYDINYDDFVFGFVGRMDPDKGINELLAAFRNVLQENKNAYLILVGPNDKVKGVDLELWNWAKNSSKVLLFGYTDEVEKYLAAMDVFILPSYREGFGSVVVEAEAMGLPVIVTDIPGPTDAIDPNVTGVLVRKGNINDLVIKMNYLMKDKNTCKQMGRKGAEFAKEKFEQGTLWKHILQDRNKLTSMENKK